MIIRVSWSIYRISDKGSNREKSYFEVFHVDNYKKADQEVYADIVTSKHHLHCLDPPLYFGLFVSVYKEEQADLACKSFNGETRIYTNIQALKKRGGIK